MKPIFIEVPTELDFLKKDTSSREISIMWKNFTIKIIDEEAITMLSKLMNKSGDKSC